MTGRAKKGWGLAFCIGAPLIGILTTMPAYGLVDVLLYDVGAYWSADRYDNARLGPFTEYQPHFLVSVLALLLWFFAYGLFIRGLRSRFSRHDFFCALVATAFCILGKFLDLLHEGVLFTGSYWTILIAGVLTASALPVRHADFRAGRTWIVACTAAVLVIWAALVFVFVRLGRGPEADVLKVAGDASFGVLVLAGLYLVVRPRVVSRMPLQSEMAS
jgi:hypothetical protein